MENGIDRPDRTGVGTRGVMGLQFRCDLSEGFPCLTTKKLLWKSAIGEILWLVEGSGDERRLAEIIHQKPRVELQDKKTVWSANASAPYWIDKAKYEGDLGRVYGVQWRHWIKPNGEELDQLLQLIEGIKNDPYGRRHLMTCWNPAELDQMALPPCHYNIQFYVVNGRLSSHLSMRSLDIFLGMPFDIIMYAALTHMVARECNLEVGEFVLTATDAHIYKNHFEAVMEQLERTPKKLPTLVLNKEKSNILDFNISDFDIIDYDPYPAIKAKMAV